MVVRVPRYRFLDYGEAALDGGRIQRQQTVNRSLEMDLEQKEEQAANRKRAQEIRRMYDDMPQQIQELEAEGMFDEANELRDSYVKTRRDEILLIEGMRQGIDENNYKTVRQQLLNVGAITGDLWPVEYSDKWFRDEIKEKRGSLDKLTRSWAGNDGVVMSQDLVSQDGQVIWAGTPFESSADRKARSGGAGGGYKAADDSAMGKQAERLFGGFYNPETGEFSGLSPEKAQQVQAVHTRATQLFRDAQGTLSHAEAIAEAARELRINIEDPTDSLATDPAGLFPNPP